MIGKSYNRTIIDLNFGRHRVLFHYVHSRCKNCSKAFYRKSLEPPYHSEEAE